MLDVFSTIVTSVLILVIGQIVVKSIIEPLQDFAKLRGEVADSLTIYGNVAPDMVKLYMTNLDDLASSNKTSEQLMAERKKELIRDIWSRSDDAAVHLRRQASQLRSMRFKIPLYKMWAWLRVVPPARNVLAASSALIGMSNSVHSGKMGEHIKRVSEFLDLDLTSY